MNHFRSFENDHGFCWQEDDPKKFPSSLHRWNQSPLDFTNLGTHFIFINEGTTDLVFENRRFTLHPGMYASVPGACQISGGSGIVVTRQGSKALFQLGGPIEEKGRLHYIDGCTDSLLIPPVRLGDPCLNLLHIPPHTHQSQHTHPSHRVGMIVSGYGDCCTPEGKIPLSPGLVFVIPEDAQHSFHTEAEALRVIAYHPESDFGPTDEVHPMVNRTLLTKP